MIEDPWVFAALIVLVPVCLLATFRWAYQMIWPKDKQ